jgi:hypothetical protein
MCRKQLIEALKASKKSKCFNSSTVAEEHGKKFRLENKSKKTICRVTVDGCLINDEHTKRCDYLFKVCETEQHFLVELKGTDVSKAVEQIISTFDLVNKKLKLDSRHFEGIIVSSSIPRAAEQKFRVLKEKCLKKKNLKIRKVSHMHPEPI